jgi:hypothetical protein
MKGGVRIILPEAKPGKDERNVRVNNHEADGEFLSDNGNESDMELNGEPNIRYVTDIPEMQTSRGVIGDG